MVNIAIRYVEKEGEGIVLAGDKGVLSPTGTQDLILECNPLHRLEEFPIVFAPAFAGDDSAVVSNFIRKITLFLYERYKPDKFSVFEFTNSFPEFYKLISETQRSYYSKEDLRDKETKFDFDFILAGSDRSREVFLYYARVRSLLDIADITFAPGYITTLMGASEGMTFLKEILQERDIPRDVALETAISILEMLRKIRQDMSPNYQIYILQNGKVEEVSDESITVVRGLMDYRWNALWITLKNSFRKPAYLDFVNKKLGR